MKTQIELAFSHARDLLADPERAAGEEGEKAADAMQDLMRSEALFFHALNAWRKVPRESRNKLAEALDALVALEDGSETIAMARNLLAEAIDLS